MEFDRELQDNFLKWTEQSLSELRSHHSSLCRDPDNSSIVDEIYAIAHNIKGMGASFGFTLMTETGVSFCRYIRSLDGRKADPDVIDAHIRSLEVILSNRIIGEGGEVGRDLIDRLTSIVDRSLVA